MEKTEQKSGGRGPAGIVKRIFGSFRDGSAEEFFSDMRWIFGYTKKYKWFVVIQILFGVLSASLSLVSAIISKYAIDIVINRKIGSLWLLIAAVAAKEGLEKKTAEKAVNAVIACVGDALAAGDKIQIAGFGTFEVRERAAKTARNPRTGETIDVPACKVPAFKAGKGLKDKVAK